MGAKACNKMLYGFLLLLLAVILPFAFVVNNILFLILIVFFILMFVRTANNVSAKFLVAFFVSVLFSGISILNLRPYDIVTIIALIYVLVKKRGTLSVPYKILPFAFVVIFVCAVNFNGDALLETVRYIISFLLLLVVLNIDDCSFDDIKFQVAIIGIVNILFAFATFLLFKKGMITNYTSGIFESNLFLSNAEVRMFGFFSDPNKFMCFSFAMIFVIEYFMKKSRQRTLLIWIFIAGSILSLSRTALLVVALYIGCKILVKIKECSKLAFWAVIISGTLIFVLLFLLDGFEPLLNFVYSSMAKILNRDWTASLGSTVTEDSRFLIWKRALEHIGESPLWGHGWMSNTFLLPYPTHNTILALMLDGGILALIPFVICFWPLIKVKRWELTLPFVIVPSLLLDLQNYRVWFLILGLILVDERRKAKQKRCENELDCVNQEMGT